jgi:hypothetical protein
MSLRCAGIQAGFLAMLLLNISMFGYSWVYDSVGRAIGLKTQYFITQVSC